MSDLSCRKSWPYVSIGGTAPVDSEGKTVGIGDAATQARRCLEINKEALINLAEFWQRQVSKFKALILSIVILWLKSITKKLGTWLSPVG